MHDPLSESLVSERLLVLGGGGWFGQTLLAQVSSDVQTLATGSIARAGFSVWDRQLIEDFKPTVVANFAFLTPDRIAIDGAEEFTRVNETLTRQFLSAIDLPSVRSAVTVSSGAAVTDPESLYGSLKLKEELALLSRVSASFSAVVARAFSVSGPFVRRPHAYAFSDIVMQAVGGHVLVGASQPTFRRYVSVADYVAVCLESVLRGHSGVIESGGELIEMGDLAERIVRRVNPAATIVRVSQVSRKSSIYASDGSSWARACRALGFSPSALEEQVDDVAAWLQGGASTFLYPGKMPTNKVN